MVSLPVVLAVTYLFHRSQRLRSSFLAYFGLYTFLNGVLFFYCLARVFLVIESFISLRAQPIGVFWTPSWLDMIPHV
ncbi:hypothetical protein B0H63DRAFT_486991 [Podospora didyma]|uniref:Uncharacterized protein n=1 Tax=Podospora didyma TaxID=330526 RepID=A0AAE0K5H2_9PEZI|nr:hypothetical protein B0H63DRAFT_486991 [Podospora didyma]